MNQITVKQLEDDFIELLAAQRQLYDDEKKLMTGWLVVTAVIAIGGTLAVSTLNVNNAYFVLASVLIAGVEFWILAMIRQRRKDAAGIQELFDSQLLELPWNSTLTDKPRSETIRAAAKRHLDGAGAKRREKLLNWYSPESNDKPMHQACLICQKQNVWWNGELRQEYIRLLYVAVIILVVVIVVVSLMTDMSLQQFLSGPVVLFAPLIFVLLKQSDEHRNAIRSLNSLRNAIEKLWQEAVAAPSDDGHFKQGSRDIQNEIYHLRSGSQPVPSWFYQWRWKKYEDLSNSSGHFTGPDIQK